jgi:hypothetical protein
MLCCWLKRSCALLSAQGDEAMLILNKFNTRERERERKKERERYRERERESPWSRLFYSASKEVDGIRRWSPHGLVHIHVLKYCQHTRSFFLSRDIPLNLMLKTNIAGLGEIDQAVQHAIVDRVITNLRQQPQPVKDWCTWTLQIPHQRVGLGIIPTSTSGITTLSWQMDGPVPIVETIIILLCISG